jgi:hypothetical protein
VDLWFKYFGNKRYKKNAFSTMVGENFEISWYEMPKID